MISAVCGRNDELPPERAARLCCRVSQGSRAHSSSVENTRFRAFSQVCGDLLCSSQKTKAPLPLFRVRGGVGGYADR